MHGNIDTHRLLRALAGGVVILVLLVPQLTATATSNATSNRAIQPSGVVSGLDVARVPGAQEAIGRSFDSFDPSETSGIGHLEFAAIAFADAESAQAALPEVFPALTPVLRQDAETAEPPALGDEALAWTAAGPESLSVAILIVRDGATIHLLAAVAESGEPLAALATIAEGVIGRTPAATPAATPAIPDDARPLTSGGLWDLLPRYDDLPGEFGLYTEESWPAEEPASAPPPSEPADCTVAPRPASDFAASASASPAAVAPPASATPATSAADGAPADAATVDGVTATIRTYVACIALGDWPRAFALFTDRLFREQVAQTQPELIEWMLDGQALVPVAEGPRLVEVRDVVVLPDGRVGAVAVIVTVSGQEVTPEPTYIWLVQEGDGYLIDELAPTG